MNNTYNRIHFSFAVLALFLSEILFQTYSTEDVTKSFGWDSNEALQQQDIQEAIRLELSLIAICLCEDMKLTYNIS